MAKTILIIDHKPGPIRRARTVLERAGYRVEVARDGAAGLSAFERLSPQLTLVGEALPDRKGPTVCRDLRDAAGSTPAPIVMIGSRRDHDRDQLGCDDYLIQPVGEEALLEAVRRHVRAGDADRPTKTVSGDLEHLNIAEIVQTLSLGLKTACISLERDTLRGRIWFEKGKVRHAVSGDLAGEAAFFQMMTWATGEFSIENGAIRPETTIERDTMFLVMEGLRRIDEAAKDSDPDATDELDIDALGEHDITSFQDEPADRVDAAPEAESLDDTTPVDEQHEPEPNAGASKGTEAQAPPAAVAAEPSAPVPVATVRSTDGRRWAWAAAVLGMVLFGVGVLATVRALRPVETSTVPVPIRIGPQAGADAASDVEVTEVDGIWDDYMPIEYSGSPLAVASAEEMHTAWKLLEQAPGDLLRVSPSDANATEQTATSSALSEPAAPVGSGADSEPAVPVVDDPPSQAMLVEQSEQTPPRESVKEPGEIDYSQSLAAANAILAKMSVPDKAPASDRSRIQLSVTSSVREGILTLFVDGNEVLSRELAAARRSRQSFDTSIPVAAGARRVVARLDLTREGYSYENSVAVDVDAGGTIALELVAGRSTRRPITLTVR